MGAAHHARPRDWRMTKVNPNAHIDVAETDLHKSGEVNTHDALLAYWGIPKGQRQVETFTVFGTNGLCTELWFYVDLGLTRKEAQDELLYPDDTPRDIKRAGLIILTFDVGHCAEDFITYAAGDLHAIKRLHKHWSLLEDLIRHSHEDLMDAGPYFSVCNKAGL